MPGSLLDTNVWLAAVFTTHPFHQAAQKNLQQAAPAEPAVFCRSTQTSVQPAKSGTTSRLSCELYEKLLPSFLA